MKTCSNILTNEESKIEFLMIKNFKNNGERMLKLAVFCTPCGSANNQT